MIQIKEPIWNIGYFIKGAKGRGVGIAADKITGTHTTIEILYQDIKGSRLWNNPLTIPNVILETFPTQIKRGTKIILAPLSAFNVVNTNELQTL